MRFLRLRLLPALAFIVFAFMANSQVYQFKQYNIEDGLSHPFVYTINNDMNGYVWIGTGEGLCRFDGFSFNLCKENDTLTNGFVSSSYLDKNGLLWFGHNSGDVTYYNGSEFKRLDSRMYLNSSVTDINSDNQGNVFVSTQNNGLLRVNPKFEIDTFTSAFKGKIIYSIASVGNSNYLVGCSDGLVVYKIEKKNAEKVLDISELAYIPVQSIENGVVEFSFWIGTEDSGFYLLRFKDDSFESYELLNIGEQVNLAFDNIQSVFEDQEKTLWVSTFGKGVFKMIPDLDETYKYSRIVQFSTQNGLPNNFIKQVYQDWEGNFWFATYGNGIAFSSDEAFAFLYQDIKELNGNVLSIEENEKNIWLGGESVIAKVDKSTNEIKIVDQRNGLPKDKITALFLDRNNKLWIGTEKSGVYQLNTQTNSIQKLFSSANSLENTVNSITGSDEQVYVATKNGVLVFNLKTGEKTLFGTSQGLPHNDIRFVYLDSYKNPWVATKSNGIFSLNDSLKYIIEGTFKLDFSSITEDMDGNMWASTYGDGVFKFSKDTIQYFSTDNGLKSNYCYSLIADNAGKIWVGHRLALSSIDTKTLEVKTYDKEDGITGDCNYNSLVKQENGILLFGTTNGIIRYDSSKEKKGKMLPKVNIAGILVSDVPHDISKPVYLPYDIYKLKISYVGLSYSDPNGIYYQYKLDGYDLEWSEITKEREVFYPRIEDGNYTFLLKACNAEGVCVEEPVSLKISVKPPIWKTWWFILIMIGLVIGLIVSYIKYRERKHKAMQEYLETELKARTKEVVAQKELLEVKNRDITDSINYAQRIQQSILPSVNTINKYFSGAFVYYQPRDIVSGDFYWYDKVNNDKFMIVCADSTGHGVPGAFMSMIGTTLIKDICLRTNIKSPSEVLEMLDKDLQSTLNQNLDAEKANDGMDIIVCEIDINTHYMRFASAMRPLIIYKGKKLQYVNGNRTSIGGYSKTAKQFENIGFQLEKGDIIYMFSDGFTDQFGGPKGKKFKIDRTKNMLADVCDKSLEEQQSQINKVFNEWRGSLHQVDDVLFMGVKI
ncbi:MAG: two-component regulator propeller domain-containing protein [Bacteroidales bacterium]|jgi:ligand-binding sensor domain-containing protein/serine phosphatase RsbU (regulator of sigma subunit)|nr:two-component regulator propeller domain-containing protein [Bacteroidales bacterium]